MMSGVPASDPTPDPVVRGRGAGRFGRGAVGLAIGLVLGVLGATLGLHGAGRVIGTVANAGHGGDPPAAAEPTLALPASSGAESMQGSTGRGLVSSKDGYTLADVAAPRAAGVAGQLTFTIRGPGGEPVRDFATVMMRPMHVYVVRADLGAFHHLRPTAREDGTWSVPLTWRSPGPYRVMAEFSAVDSRDGIHHLVLGRTLKVPGTYRPAILPKPSTTAVVDGYRVSLSGNVGDAYSSGSLRLHVTRQGEDVASLQPYHGSFVYVTCFRAGDNALMRTIPVEQPDSAHALGGPKLTLMPVFPAPGDYRMFLEFRTFDEIRTASVTMHAP
jgi:hypothetical protein